MRSSWPKKLRIHPANNPLLVLPDSHPAKLTIIVHAECCRDCVGKEIEWPSREAEAFDQSWHSELIDRKFSFSSYTYTFLSIDLILEEWISRPSQITECEVSLLAAIPYQEILLDECDFASNTKSNQKVLDRMPQIRRFNELHLQSVRRRLEEDGIEIPQLCKDGDPLAILGLQFPGR